MQIAVQTYWLSMTQEVGSDMQIQGQELVSQKEVVQTQTAIQTATQTKAVIQI